MFTFHPIPSTGRSSDRLSVSSAKEKRPASTGNPQVKFDDEHIEEIEPDDLSVMRTTPFPSSAASAYVILSVNFNRTPLIQIKCNA